MGKIKLPLRLLLFVAMMILLGSTVSFAATSEANIFPPQSAVDLNHPWHITFNDQIKSDSVTPDNIKIINTITGDIVDNPAPEVQSGGKSVLLKPPYAGYQPGTKYTLIIDGIESTSNKKLARPVKKGFITRPPDQPTVLGQMDKTIENPGRENLVTYQDQLSVLIPPHALGSDASLTIREVIGAQHHDYSGLKAYATYDIELDQRFTGDLTLRFKYDPVFLNPAYEPADQLMVAFFDDETRTWIETDFSIDDINQEIVVLTDHLSSWSLFTSWVPVNGPHMRIFYNADINAPLLTGAPVDPDMVLDPMSRFILSARQALIEAHEAYSSQHFLLPDMYRVYINDFGPEASAEWDFLTKDIKIPTNIYDWQELRHACAHELFHAVQNQYRAFTSMLTNRWWMEATADYAAAEMLGTKRYVPVNSLYLTTPLGTIVTNDFHEYRSARFIDYLVRYHGIDFAALWRDTVDNWSSDMVSVLGDYVTGRTGAPMSELYRGYIQHIIFSSDNPNLSEALTPYQLANRQTKMFLDTKELAQSSNLAQYSSYLWAVTPEIRTSAPTRNLIVEMDEDTPEGVFVDIFKLGDQQRLAGKPIPIATLTVADDAFAVAVGSGETLFVLASNGTTAATSYSVKVKELDFTVDPEELETVPGKTLDFTLKTKNIPQKYTSVKFVWDFGDGETEDKGNLSQDDKIVPVIDGRAETVISHKYMEENDYTLEANLQDPGGKTMAKAISKITIPEQEVEVIISPPRIVTYELASGATEAPHEFNAVVTPDGTYRLEWDFGDGTPVHSATGSHSNVWHTYTEIGKYYPKVTVFSPENVMLAEDAISIIVEKADDVALVYGYSHVDAYDNTVDWGVKQALKQIGNIMIGTSGNFSHSVPVLEGQYHTWDNDANPWSCRVNNFNIQGHYDDGSGTGTANVSLELHATMKEPSWSSISGSGYYVSRLRLTEYNHVITISGDLELHKLFKGAWLMMDGDLVCNLEGSINIVWTEVEEPIGTGYPPLPEPTTTDDAETYNVNVQYNFTQQ